ncbi:MAG TPA: ThuA domain-containing protein [Phycisphaerae bacterium]|nr:ThuA domain-containing protein [Phycisphaerae bacterium]
MPAAKSPKRQKKNVLLLIGGTYHPFEACAKIAGHLLKSSGRYALTVTDDREALAKPLGKYDAVMIYTCGGAFTDAQQAGLRDFVRGGGGLVAIHSANAISGECADYIALVGSRFATHPADHKFEQVRIVDASHPATTRMKDFSLVEELYVLKDLRDDVQVLAETSYLGRPMPVMYARTEGKGRVFYTALGHGARQWRVSGFQRSLLHGLDWACRMEPLRRGPIRCAALGYGPSFNMGRLHCGFINGTAGLKAVGVCDIDPARTKAAKEDYPDIRTYGDCDELLKAKDVDLVVVILPHHIHAEYARKCLNAGRHVITEKPFCLTVREADGMLRAARKNGVMITAFHNRRWDGDFRTIRRIVEEGTIGEVFEINCGFSGYNAPRDWWRSDKEISGGNLYDWGAHFTDWVLQLIPEKIASVQGFFHKGTWVQATNEDHTQAIIRFANGAMADVTISSLSAAGRPRWRVLGTRGAILDDGTVEKGCKVITYEEGALVTRQVKWIDTAWDEFYPNVADHLLLGDELVIKPQQARRVIGVIESAERSANSGQPEVFPGEA